MKLIYIINIAHAQNVPFKTAMNSNVSETDVTSRLQNVVDKKHAPKNNMHVIYLLPTIFLYDTGMLSVTFENPALLSSLKHSTMLAANAIGR